MKHISQKKLAKCRALFDEYDSSKTGSISFEQVNAALKKNNIIFSDEQFADVIRVVDQNKNGKVEFEEFKSIFGLSEK